MKSALQSLVGKLSFISKCRVDFFCLAFLICCKHSNGMVIALVLLQSFVETLRGGFGSCGPIMEFLLFPLLSGLLLTLFSTDACSLGCGGLSQSQYFHVQFPQEVLAWFSEIHLFEALTILVALRLWGHLWAGCCIQVFCDNTAVVSALTSGKVKDQSLAALLRDIWYLAASHDFELRAVHLPGEENRAADLLSHWHLDSSFGACFRQLSLFASLSSVSVLHDFFTIYNY